MADETLAPTPIYLGGKEYTLSPLGDDDIEELNNWLRADVIRMAESAIDDDTPPDRAREIRRMAIETARGLSWISGDGAKAMASLNGISRVVWQGLKRNHPELSHVDVRKLIIDKKTIDYAMSVWKELNLKPAVNRNKEGRPAGNNAANGSPKASVRSQKKPSRPSSQSE